MLMVQKQPSFALASPALHHRRLPSAPVVVQPTRTPGLLSLAKPPRPSQQPRVQAQQQHVQRIRSTPKPKSASRPTNPHQPAAAENEEPLPAVPKASQTQTPDRNQPRGRQNNKPQKSATRSASHSSTRGARRPHNRQPSPPLEQALPPSSQAEVPSMPSKTLFDPFLDDISNNPTLKPSAPPALSSQPSGKLARRRQQQQKQPSKNQNASTNPVPVPHHPKRFAQPSMARSDPIPSHIRHPAAVKSQPGTKAWDSFPICDDMTDIGDPSDVAVLPVTPTRHRSRTYGQVHSEPPRSAPLHGFFPATPSPPQHPAFSQRKSVEGRKHRRTPSDGVFTMSSDEEANSSSTSSSGPLTPNVEALFKLVRNQRFNSDPATPLAGLAVHPATVPRTRESREKQLEREAAAAVAASYFASSNFQNSPSPDELPPPLFA